jgi:hypothetical protein
VTHWNYWKLHLYSTAAKKYKIQTCGNLSHASSSSTRLSLKGLSKWMVLTSSMKEWTWVLLAWIQSSNWPMSESLDFGNLRWLVIVQFLHLCGAFQLFMGPFNCHCTVSGNKYENFDVGYNFSFYNFIILDQNLDKL